MAEKDLGKCQKVNLLDTAQPPSISIENNNFNEESKSVISEEKEEQKLKPSEKIALFRNRRGLNRN